MKLADAFQAAESKRPGHRPHLSSASPRTGEIHITWSNSEWMTLTRSLIRLFPDLGMPSPEGVQNLRLRHVNEAMQALPESRHRHITTLTNLRPRILQCCIKIIAEGQRPASLAADPAPLPSSVIHRQPDGASNGKPPNGARIFWRESEWYQIAIELAYIDPTLLDTLNHLQPSAVYRAQRVLPTNRRRQQTSFSTAKIREELGPAFKRVRADIEAARLAQAQASAKKLAEESRSTVQAQHAAQEAAQASLLNQAMESPEIIARALSAAAIGPLFEALMARGAASLQGMIEGALLNAFASDRIKQAMMVNLYMDRSEGPAQTFTANAPAVSATAPAKTICRPKVGILGALAQQGEIIAAAYPQLRIKAIDKNLTGATLRESLVGCDRVIAMTHFISHSMDGVAYKALGERYTRVDGGVSAVRRMIDVWLSSGVLQAASVPAAEAPAEGKAE